MPKIPAVQLEAFAKELISRLGTDDDIATIVAEHLVTNNLLGVDSHGVQNLTYYSKLVREGLLKTEARPKIIRDSGAIALVDGYWGWGQSTAKKCMDVAIDKAARYGIGAAGAVNCTHIGRVGAWSEVAARHDMIGVVMANSDPSVAPFGGTKPLLGTNPIAIAVPAGSHEPIVVDMATSAVAEGKVRAAYFKGEKIPKGWIVDSRGEPTENPGDLYLPPMPPLNVIFGGAQLPMGGLQEGHKGFGLALAVDAIAGALTGTGCGDHVKVQGAFFQAINVEAFTSTREFKKEIDDLISRAKGNPKMKGFQEVIIPGEPEARTRAKRLEEGITISPQTWNSLLDLAAQLKVDVTSLPKSS